jgi:hypothetical protein
MSFPINVYGTTIDLPDLYYTYIYYYTISPRSCEMVRPSDSNKIKNGVESVQFEIKRRS